MDLHQSIFEANQTIEREFEPEQPLVLEPSRNGDTFFLSPAQKCEQKIKKLNVLEGIEGPLTQPKLPELLAKNQLSDLDDPSNNVKLMRFLQSKIPTNNIGLPEFIYRPDVIPTNIGTPGVFTPLEQSQYLETAIIDIDYSHGYATLPSGEPFWSKLPYEPGDAFMAFKMYLEMPMLKTNDMRGAVRQLDMLRIETGIKVETLTRYSHMYYWKLRTQAYDLFRVAKHRKIKEMRAAFIEDDHFVKAGELLSKVHNRVEDIISDPLEAGISPQHILNFFLKLMEVQRISVGVNGNASAKDNENIPKNASMEVVMRTIAKSAGFAQIIDAGDVNAQDYSDRLINDADSLVKAQELIIKMNQGSQV